MELIAFLFFITAPVFYLVGLIETFRAIFKPKSKQEEETQPLKSYSENLLLEELSEAVEANDLEKAKRILKVSEYKAQKVSSVGALKFEGTKTWFENWYSDNSIDLLLYLGAFLIIASAGTFVGFNWQSFSSEIKALLLGILTAAFFLAGFYLYFATKKVKRAGLTFIAIGSLLIPFNGWAWYNFVLKPEIGADVVWFFTSLVGVVIWALLAILIKRKFFLYLAGAGVLSTSESLVSISNLSFEYYTTAAVFSGFVFILAKMMTRAEKMIEDAGETFSYLAYVSIPVAIIASTWAFAWVGRGSFFTGMMTINLFLIALFFRIAHFLDSSENKPIFMIVSQVFGTLGVYSFVQAAKIELVWSLYIFAGLSILYWGLAVLFRKVGFKTESEGSATLSLIIAFGVYLVGLSSSSVENLHLVFFGTLIVLLFWNVFYWFKLNGVLYLKNASWYFVLWPLVKEINASVDVYPYYFVGLAAVIYLVSFAFPKRDEIATAYRYSGLVAALLWVIIFGIYSISSVKYNILELNALITSYFTGLLFALEASRSRRFDIGIVASVIFLGTLLWNFKYIELENVQFYSLPLAIYLFGLGFLARQKEKDYSDIVDLAAGAILILPTFVQAAGETNGYWYALLLGAEGVLILVLAISWNKVIYKYLGIAALVLAVISQTYEYLTSLPRWVIIGGVGLVFLAAAIYLLASRKEDK
ncbi:hypothetical protein HYU92_04665 [Candidatus Curtissbacteria bacterium]|nr:hypothetical protein [Candidatus Curtissbacteria bacterium]